jgi:hypothetical protein
MVGSCACGIEPFGSIKGRKFLDSQSVLLPSHRGLCTMEFINNSTCEVCAIENCCPGSSDDPAT